jgi:hypothetical protein
LPILSSRLIKETLCRSAVKFPSSLVKRDFKFGVLLLVLMNHVEMRYSPSTLQFVWLGRKLFGGRFIRFMSGPKNESDILTGEEIC